MLRYRCDLCHRDLDPEEDLRYVVKMEVYAAFDPTDTNVALTITDDSGTGNIADVPDQPTVAISDGTPNPATEGSDPSITASCRRSGTSSRKRRRPSRRRLRRTATGRAA